MSKPTELPDDRAMIEGHLVEQYHHAWSGEKAMVYIDGERYDGSFEEALEVARERGEEDKI